MQEVDSITIEELKEVANYQVDRASWVKLDIFEQMGNIGSEVGRAIKAHRSGNAKREQGAFDRALDLMDATVYSLVCNHKRARAREVLLAREEFARLFFDETFDQDADAIERYFMNYAVAARLRNSADKQV